jgi:hypothetical protein
MKKTLVFCAVLLLVFITHACELPASIKFKSDNFKMNAPTRYGRFNLATVLTAATKDSFPEGFELYDMINYPNVQAFLIGYPMDIMESFNPDDYLNNPDGIDPIYPEPIVIPKMTSDIMSDFWFLDDMQDFFDDMRDKINAGTLAKNIVTSPYELPYFMVYEDCDTMKQLYFDLMSVAAGTIELNMWLAGAAPNVDINSVSFGSYSNNQPVQITSSHNAGNPCKVYINIDGAVINKNNPPKFILNGISPSSGYTLVMKPQIINITLHGATALKIGEMTKPLPPEVINNIRMERIPDMLNAEIAEGEFRMTAEPHPSCAGLIVEPEVTIRQDPAYIYGYPPFNGLGTKTFKKNTDPSLDNELISGSELTVEPLPLSKISIKANTVNGSTFNLEGGMLRIQMDMGLNIDTLDVVRWRTISEVTGRRTLPPIDIPPVTFANMGDHNVSFIRSITIKEVLLNANFTVPDPPPPPLPGRDLLTPGPGLSPEQALEGRLALKVSSHDLGFEEVSGENPKEVQNGDNEFTSTLEPPRKVNTSGTLVKIDAELRPVVGGDVKDADFPYMEFGPVSGTEEVRMNIYAQVTVKYTWTEAEIDVKTALKETESEEGLTGQFPENTGNGNFVNLSNLGRYMHGITVGGIKAKIFTSGPSEVMEKMRPELLIDAQWSDDTTAYTLPMLDEENRKIVGHARLPKLPGINFRGEWNYADITMPEEGNGSYLNGFDEIFSAFPRDLFFSYEVILGNDEPITVYPHSYDDADDDSKIRALLIILLPLDLIAEPGGYFAIPDLFDVNEDLFGRTNADDPTPFTGVNISSLSMRMNFGNSLFVGSYLHFDKDDLLFGENGFGLGKGNNMRITFTGEQQRIINENLIYPDIKIVYPEGKTLEIARDFMPVRIIVTVSGSYTLDIDDLGLGN